jgi:hypothetical protein
VLLIRFPRTQLQNRITQGRPFCGQRCLCGSCAIYGYIQSKHGIAIDHQARVITDHIRLADGVRPALAPQANRDQPVVHRNVLQKSIITPDTSRSRQPRRNC